MQTTLRIDDQIFRHAKAEAARLGVTLTKFIEDALRDRIERPTAGSASVDVEVERRERLMEGLLQATAHFKRGDRPTREEMNER